MSASCIAFGQFNKQLFNTTVVFAFAEMFSKYGDELGEPKTPSSDMLHMAAQFLPQDVQQATYPNEYGLPGPGFTYPDHHFLPLQPQCLPVHEAYQGYVSYGQFTSQDYYVQTSASLQGSDVGGQEAKFSQEYPGGYPGPGGMYVIASAPSTPPPYPPPPIFSCGEGVGPIVPITCESLEAAGCAEMVARDRGMSLEKASVKLKDLCMSAPPPTLSPLQQCFPLVDDNNNDLRGMVKDAELERKMGPGISEGHPGHQNSPKKTRLAARFHRQLTPSSMGKADSNMV